MTDKEKLAEIRASTHAVLVSTTWPTHRGLISLFRIREDDEEFILKSRERVLWLLELVDELKGECQIAKEYVEAMEHTKAEMGEQMQTRGDQIAKLVAENHELQERVRELEADIAQCRDKYDGNHA